MKILNKIHGNYKHGGTLDWGKSMKKSVSLAFYRRFHSMKARCESVTDSSYRYYGGRGVINTWLLFEDFKEDMYVSFVEHISKNGITNTTLDRINNNGNYSKTNCRWATRKVQSLNKTNTNILTYQGISDSFSGWSKRTGIPRITITRRIKKYSWSTEKTLTEPTGIIGKNLTINNKIT